MPARRCGRKRVNGLPCREWALRGQTVCHLHGGKAPQNLRKAEERMRDLVHPAIGSLARQIEADQFAAVKYVLDWAGFRSETVAQSETSMTVTVHFDHADQDSNPTLSLPAAD
jgi:hypothetical protein